MDYAVWFPIHGTLEYYGQIEEILESFRCTGFGEPYLLAFLGRYVDDPHYNRMAIFDAHMKIKEENGWA